MNKAEAIAVLTAAGVNYNANASAQELGALATLIKSVPEDGLMFSSPKFADYVKSAKENEYPNYGGDVPVGTVVAFTGGGTVKIWHNKRTDRDVNILVAFVRDENGKVWEIASASFSRAEFPFVSFDGRDAAGAPKFKEISTNELFSFTSSVADRNSRLAEIEVGRKFKVCRAHGHYNNPYATRVWDFDKTWLEPMD